MGREDPDHRRNRLEASRERAAVHDLEEGLLDAEWDALDYGSANYCASCDYCDPSLAWWREWLGLEVTPCEATGFRKAG